MYITIDENLFMDYMNNYTSPKFSYYGLKYLFWYLTQDELINGTEDELNCLKLFEIYTEYRITDLPNINLEKETILYTNKEKGVIITQKNENN